LTNKSAISDQNQLNSHPGVITTSKLESRNVPGDFECRIRALNTAMILLWRLVKVCGCKIINLFFVFKNV